MPDQPAQEDPPKPRRRARFQIHLSTAIVLMFVAGGLIWANINHRKPVAIISNYDFSGGVSDPIISNQFAIGWPLTFEKSEFSGWYKGNDALRSGVNLPLGGLHISGIPLFADLVVALAILFATWYICEWLIRRRSSRKGD